MKTKISKILPIFFIFWSTLLNGQNYIEDNKDFTLCFPSKPVFKGAPNTYVKVLEYTEENLYTFQISCEPIPINVKRDDFDICNDENTINVYIKSIGGGYVTEKNIIKIQNYKAVEYVIRITNYMSAYKYVKYTLLMSNNNLYSLLLYHNGKDDKFSNYLNCFVIKK